MTKYIIKRILIAIPVLLGITVIDYAIMCMAGSPLEMLQGPRVSEAAVQAKAIALGSTNHFMYSILYGWGSFCMEIWDIPLKITSRLLL